MCIVAFKANPSNSRNTVRGQKIFDTMQPIQLSSSDSKTLAQVFDPESGPKPEVVIDRALPADRHIDDASLLRQLRARERDAISLIEAYEKSATGNHEGERAVYWEAMSILNHIADLHPHYASVLNNRAQLRRWYWGDRNLLCQRRSAFSSEQKTAAADTVVDLKQSIALSSPAKHTDAVSSSQGRLLAQAYTQLGAVYYAAAKDLNIHQSEEDEPVEPCTLAFLAWTKEDFEEEASRLFFLGGLYGNEVAKALAVHTNPQAKLCGEIVKEAMRKELSIAS